MKHIHAQNPLHAFPSLPLSTVNTEVTVHISSEFLQKGYFLVNKNFPRYEWVINISFIPTFPKTAHLLSTRVCIFAVTEIWGDFRAGWRGNYFIQRCIHSLGGAGGKLTRTTVLGHSQSRTVTMDATTLTACSSPPFPSVLSATLLFLPTTLVPPHPCKVRTCRTDLIPAPLLPFARVFPEEETHSPSSFSSTCLQEQTRAWLSRFLDLSPQCQGNSVKPRLTSTTKTIHLINCNYVPIISEDTTYKTCLWLSANTFFSSGWFQELDFFTRVIAQLDV